MPCAQFSNESAHLRNADCTMLRCVMSRRNVKYLPPPPGQYETFTSTGQTLPSRVRCSDSKMSLPLCRIWAMCSAVSSAVSFASTSVIRMLAQFFKGVAGKTQERIIDLEEPAVLIRDIESVRGRLDHGPILGFTVAQGLLGLLPPGDVGGNTG